VSKVTEERQPRRHPARREGPASHSLESYGDARLLWVVRAPSESPPIVVGSLLAAATTGALVAMGHRAGHVAMPFAAIGAVPFQRTSDSGVVGLVFIGFVFHVAMMFVWAALYAALAQRSRHRVIIAIAFAAANFLCSWIVTWSTARGLAAVLPLGDRIVYAIAFAIALVVGMRYAFSYSRNA
jgi:hypothetical protein